LIGRSIELTLPLVLSSAQVDFSLTNTQLGLFAMAEVLGVTIASASSYFWVSRITPSVITLVGILAFALGNIVTPFVPIEWLVTTRFVTALFGEGLLLIVATSTLCSTAQTSRVYAVYMAAQMLVGAGLLSAQGVLASAYGLFGVMMSLTLPSLLALWTLPVFRQLELSQRNVVRPRMRVLTWRSFFILAGMGVYHIGIGGTWAFLQQRGTQHGLDLTQGGLIMSGIMASGLIGNLIAVASGHHFGHFRPLLLGVAGLGVGGVLVGLAGNLLLFIAGGVSLMVAWNLSVPYQIAFLGDRDHPPSHLALVPAFQGAGLAAGPMLVGLLASADDYSIIALISMLAASLAAACFYLGHNGVKT